MQPKIEDIQKLRNMTGAGMMAAKNALVEAKGDMDKAIELLRLAGATSAAKKSDREARQGVIESYVHGGRIGVLVEINCETDFVARTEDFKALAKDVAMHIAAASPTYLSPDDIPESEQEKEKNIFRTEAGDKPEAVVAKIIEGKLEKYYQSVCLLNQPFVKDPDKTVAELVTEMVAKLGENIIVRRFRRLELGENDG